MMRVFLFLLLLAGTLSAQVELTTSNVVRILPVPDSVTFGPEIGYSHSNGVHVAYFSGASSPSNLLVWTDGAWFTNKFISGFDGGGGLAITTNAIFGIPGARLSIYEYTWPGGTATTNFPIDVYHQYSPRIILTKTNNAIITVSNAPTASKFFIRQPDGTWSATTNINMVSSGAYVSSMAEGSDNKIYFHVTHDANPDLLLRLWQTNGTLEVTDNAYSDPVPSWGFQNMEFPAVRIVADTNRMLLYGVGGGQFDYACTFQAARYMVVALSNNYATNVVLTLPWFCDRVTSPQSLVFPGTNGLLHFAFKTAITNGCQTMTLQSAFTYSGSNIVVQSTKTPVAFSPDGWIIYRGRFNEWCAEKVTPP